MGNQEHYIGSRCQKDALGLTDQLIGYETAKNDEDALELLKKLRVIIELHWRE